MHSHTHTHAHTHSHTHAHKLFTHSHFRSHSHCSLKPTHSHTHTSAHIYTRRHRRTHTWHTHVHTHSSLAWVTETLESGDPLPREPKYFLSKALVFLFLRYEFFSIHFVSSLSYVLEYPVNLLIILFVVKRVQKKRKNFVFEKLVDTYIWSPASCKFTVVRKIKFESLCKLVYLLINAEFG